MPFMEKKSSQAKKKAIIIGGGPAGLTAALELLRHTDVQPIVLEASAFLGGISRTVQYKGNRMDIGGHRFFSKSDQVMRWWLDILPLQAENTQTPAVLSYQGQQRAFSPTDFAFSPDEDPEQVMLLRDRKSRIYFRRKFFDYPISLSWDTLAKLGLVSTSRILGSYLYRIFAPRRPEKNLEDFFINRFGTELYLTFFKSYTEKVWGVSCQEISAEWGAQRIKGLSIWKTIGHLIRDFFRPTTPQDIAQKDLETSLIEKFLYPKYGPGQMWETVARQVLALGGEIHLQSKVFALHRTQTQTIEAVSFLDEQGQDHTIEGDYFISSMPIQDLLKGLEGEKPSDIQRISQGLCYRDFITVGLLLDELKIGSVKDNWIYIQEPEVKVGRLQIFNNWSPAMVADPDHTYWIGLEYFCYTNDPIWQMSDEALIQLAIDELALIQIIDPQKVRDATVIRMPKTYPAYFGTYDQFPKLREYLDAIHNLYLVGRNGMHKYNNQDHSMLTAMEAVQNIKHGVRSKENIWAVNTEQTYHEKK